MIHHGQQCAPMTLTVRIIIAVKQWVSFWARGMAPPTFPTRAVPPIQLSHIRHVLGYTNPRKALGAELAALPNDFLEKLAGFYSLVEIEGNWPTPK